MTTYEISAEFNAGFGWQRTVWRNGALMSRTGYFETEAEAIAKAHRFMRGKEYTVRARKPSNVVLSGAHEEGGEA